MNGISIIFPQYMYPIISRSFSLFIYIKTNVIIISRIFSAIYLYIELNNILYLYKNKCELLSRSFSLFIYIKMNINYFI